MAEECKDHRIAQSPSLCRDLHSVGTRQVLELLRLPDKEVVS